MRRFTILLAVTALAMTIAAPAFASRGGTAGSPATDPFIWANGEQYAAIVQKHLEFNGNEKSYDLFHVIEGGEEGQTPVSEAAPGDNDYNGGRWVKTPVEWSADATPVLITSDDQLLGLAAAGDVTIGDPMYDAACLCPLIPGQS